MLRQFSGEDHTGRKANLPLRQRLLLARACKDGGFATNPLEDILHEGLHDAHSTPRNPDLGVDLLENLEDVR